jgi:hypothetical protein
LRFFVVHLLTFFYFVGKYVIQVLVLLNIAAHVV